jgi:hypothetical protein
MKFPRSVLGGLLLLPLVASVILVVIFAVPARVLAGQEAAVLHEIFPAGLRFDSIRIARLPMPSALTAFVIGNHISFRRGYYTGDFSRDPYKMRQLVHEVAHVWANQNGSWYTSFSAVLEHLVWRDSVYVWQPDSREFGEYRLEQQARIFETYYWKRHQGEDVTDLLRLIHPAAEF